MDDEKGRSQMRRQLLQLVFGEYFAPLIDQPRIQTSRPRRASRRRGARPQAKAAPTLAANQPHAGDDGS